MCFFFVFFFFCVGFGFVGGLCGCLWGVIVCFVVWCWCVGVGWMFCVCFGGLWLYVKYGHSIISGSSRVHLFGTRPVPVRDCGRADYAPSLRHRAVHRREQEEARHLSAPVIMFLM